MASLNLIPDPQVLAVQVGVFLVNAAVIKKLFVEPYLKVNDRREAATIGGKDSALKMLDACETLTTEIENRLASASDEAKRARELTREKAQKERAQLVKSAETDAKAVVEEVEARIKSDLATEKAKIPQMFQTLVGEVYSAALA
jgi:F0F1-type ATP synthase membrane subunit b/b'